MARLAFRNMQQRLLADPAGPAAPDASEPAVFVIPDSQDHKQVEHLVGGENSQAKTARPKRKAKAKRVKRRVSRAG